MNDLLKKARSYRQGEDKPSKIAISVTRGEVPLVIAYLNGQVTTREYAHAIGTLNPGTVTHRVPVVLKEMIARGWITIKPLKNK